LNKISEIYTNCIYKIFRFGINSFYKSNNNSGTENNYQKMLKMKQLVYEIFNKLTKNLQHEKYKYFKKIIFKNIPFYIRPLILSDVVMTSPAWEPYVKKVFVPKNDEIVIDVGAHIGTYAIPMAVQIGKSGKVLIIEPNPNNIIILKKNIEINRLQNVILIEKAVSNKNEISNLTLSDDPMLSMINNNTNDENIEIECVTLDSICEKFNIEKIDWLKIDAESSEIRVLEGAKIILEKIHPKIIVEVRKENEIKLKEILNKNGYNIKFLGGEYFFAE
jgi:FkbM family methyltransferase